jgi:hypothetical protein
MTFIRHFSFVSYSAASTTTGITVGASSLA